MWSMKSFNTNREVILKEVDIKMVHGLEEINSKISTQFKLLELVEMETERLTTRNEKS